jgi:hypothetical protein
MAKMIKIIKIRLSQTRAAFAAAGSTYYKENDDEESFGEERLCVGHHAGVSVSGVARNGNACERL